MRIAAIVNPASGRKAAGKGWPALLSAAGAWAIPVDTFWSQYPGHSEDLAASARRSGYGRVIAVGGDGTLFEVLNGLCRESEGSMPEVGMVPFGTGCDYIRNYDVGIRRIDRLRAALGESTIPVSLGKCSYWTQEGRREKVFAMVAGLGFDAQVVRRFRSRRFIRSGWSAYALSAFEELKNIRPYSLEGSIDGSTFRVEAAYLSAAIGSFTGMRMAIAPAASPSRGTFEVVWANPSGRLGLLPMVFLSYFGALARHPQAGSAIARRISLNSSPPAWIQADGEPLGTTPVDFEIIPGAFSFAARGLRKSFPGGNR